MSASASAAVEEDDEEIARVPSSVFAEASARLERRPVHRGHRLQGLRARAHEPRFDGAPAPACAQKVRRAEKICEGSPRRTQTDFIG